MSSQQKRGFRLPWAADRSTDDASGAATLEADSDESTTQAQIEDGVGGDLGEGPFHFADAATPDASTDAPPEASDVPETAAEAAMLNTESATTEPVEAASTTDDAPQGVNQAQETGAETEPDGDTFQAVTAEAFAPEQADSGQSEPEKRSKPVAVGPAKKAAGDPPATRTNPLVAGLIKAMREAAIASRAETTTRLQSEATARVEEIRSSGTEEAAALRKRVDEDIASIRDWSKGEMARIRQETEAKIEARRAEAIAENDRHTAHIERLVEQVQGRVEAYETNMDGFFEELLAENDPTRLAALAGQAPEPPELTGELPAFEDEPAMLEDDGSSATSEWDDVAWGVSLAEIPAETEAEPTTGPEAEAAAETTTDEAAPQTTDDAAQQATDDAAEPATGLEAAAAAEAEVASTEGLDMRADGVWPSSVLAAARRTLHHTDPSFEAAGVANTRMYVNGLTSVAGISAFKGALGQLPGVRSVSVSSGEPGVFIFTVVHTPETDLQDGVAGLTSFSARVTDASGESLTVVAQEPAA